MKLDDKSGLGRREFLKRSAQVGISAAGLFAGKAWAVEPESELGVAVFTTRAPGRFKILAITDLHFFGRNRLKDAWTLREIAGMIQHFSPDLLVVCGDVWYENPKHRGLEFCKGAIANLVSLSLPWAYVRGNHDKADDFNECHALLSAAPKSLYRGGPANGSYRIEVRSPGAEKPFWNLLILNDAAPELGLRDAQIAWVKTEAARIRERSGLTPPAFLFAHIPIPQYQDIVDAGLAYGVKREKVSYEGGSREAFAALKETGMVKAMFCGHDHVNNYHGVLEGIHLEYVRSTGHAGYGGTRVLKGGTLITVDATKPEAQFATATVFSSGRVWQNVPRIKAK